MKESNFLSLAKAVSWRIFGTSATWVLAFFVTGDLMLSTKFSFFEFVVKIALYYLHERMWQTNIKLWREKLWKSN